MAHPAVTRRRRPFLTPVWLILLAALVVIGVGLGFYESATNTLFVIVSPASQELGSIADPPLSAAGEQQAQELARRFAASSGPDGIAAIYVGGTHRAMQTAAPLAQLLGKSPVALTSQDPEAIAAQILSEHAGGNVLVVSPQAGVAGLVQTLSGQQIQPTGDPRAAWIVTVPSYGPASVLRISY